MFFCEENVTLRNLLLIVSLKLKWFEIVMNIKSYQSRGWDICIFIFYLTVKTLLTCTGTCIQQSTPFTKIHKKSFLNWCVKSENKSCITICVYTRKLVKKENMFSILAYLRDISMYGNVIVPSECKTCIPKLFPYRFVWI